MSARQVPVFFDKSGGRWRRFRRAVTGSLLVLSGMGAAFSFTLLALPSSALVLKEQGALTGLELPLMGSREQAARRVAAAQATERLEKGIAADQQRAKRGAHRRTGTYSTIVGFYVSWDPGGFDSFRDHADELTYVVPGWLGLRDDGESFTYRFDPESRDPQMLALAAQHGVKVMPMLDNLGRVGFEWRRLEQLLEHPDKQRRLAERIGDFLVEHRFAGVNVDLEPSYAGLDDAAEAAARALVHDRMPDLILALKRVLEPRGLTVTQDVPAADPAFDLPRLGELNDFVIPMFYDQHVASGDPGPIASQEWIEQVAEKLFRDLDPARTVIGLGNYAADWPAKLAADGTISAAGAGTNPTLADALDLADQSGARLEMDEDELNPRFAYVDQAGQDHLVYLLDACTAYNQVMALKGYEPLGVALWRLGSEDPALWSFFGEGRVGAPVPPARFNEVDLGSRIAQDPLGRGEIMEVTELPRPGQRRVTTDADGLIASEQYVRYPRPYVLTRYGANDAKAVALTFDDGPDPEFTPRILDVLRAERAPATFFVIGGEAEGRLDLLRRAWDQGSEIGNHTFTHPHIAAVSALRSELELNATQRLIESAIGRSTRLFRPPYGDGADVNATTPEDAAMLLRAQRLGYVTVGMNVDPKDYLDPGPDTIVQRVLDSLAGAGRHETRNVVLLHDGGGDRTQTVRALPSLIRELRHRGYRLVTVSQLLGPDGRGELFPSPLPRQEEIAGFDRVVFEAGFALNLILGLAFLAAITLGVARILLLAPLALLEARRARRGSAAPFAPPVTVLVPAYNEERVVGRTVSTVLASDYPALNVIVIDDGSSDDTAGAASRQFADEPHVRVVRKENGGKATALNHGLELTSDEFVVCIDADTVLAPDAIGKLVAPLSDPRVGAVAGNVKVGNRRNPLTLWQSVEYITSQNFDRRAYSMLHSVPIVPGAIGAWRKAAVIEAGGYESTTLAEDSDLTFKVRLLGYHTVAVSDAKAYTEVPEEVRSLNKQRFRWAFGVLQALWKHRAELFRPRHGAFGMVVMPSLWLFNVLFLALAPIVDVTVVISLFTHEFWTVAAYAAALFALDLGASLVAYRLDRENPLELVWLFLQRLFYRQFMYYVVLRAMLAAIRGRAVGWGKLQRRGTAVLPSAAQNE
jgi:peptidoglycan-N-acetylglucosamine deacetylase